MRMRKIKYVPISEIMSNPNIQHPPQSDAWLAFKVKQKVMFITKNMPLTKVCLRVL